MLEQLHKQPDADITSPLHRAQHVQPMECLPSPPAWCELACLCGARTWTREPECGDGRGSEKGDCLVGDNPCFVVLGTRVLEAGEACRGLGREQTVKLVGFASIEIVIYLDSSPTWWAANQRACAEHVCRLLPSLYQTPEVSVQVQQGPCGWCSATCQPFPLI